MSLRFLAAVVLPAIVLCGCGDDVGWSSSACSPPATPVDGGMLVMGAVQGTIGIPFSVNATGAGTGPGPVGSIDLIQDQGQVAIQGTKLATLAYQRTTAGNYSVYQAIAVGSDGWYFLWVALSGTAGRGRGAQLLERPTRQMARRA
jgi:hypothetical protein